MTVPDGVAPGVYTLDVYCEGISNDLGALETGQYSPSPTFTVTAAASAPAEVVTAAPRTTG